MFEVYWNKYAELTFSEEIEFILFKWNASEAQSFIELVDKSIQTISTNPFVGKKINTFNFALVISKQTTIYYRVFEEHQYIEILLFWSNTRNPKRLLQYIQKK